MGNAYNIYNRQKKVDGENDDWPVDFKGYILSF